MFMRRVVPVSILLALVLALVASVGVVSAQEEEEVTLGGSVTFRDASALSDSLVITLTGVPLPQAGTQYEGWLIAADGSKISVGILSVPSSGVISQTYTATDGANLLAWYNTFAISEEPDPDTDLNTSGSILYFDTIPTEVFTHVGHLAVAWPANPDGKGIVVGLREQVKAAAAHAALAQTSATLASKQSYLHQVVNIIEGSDGANYDASFADLGDGLGVLTYAADAITHANLLKTGQPADSTEVANADALIAAANDVITLATQARDQALLGVAATAEGLPLDIALSNTVSRLTQASSDADTAYVKAQDIALLVLKKGAPEAPPTPTPNPNPTPTPHAPPPGGV